MSRYTPEVVALSVKLQTLAREREVLEWEIQERVEEIRQEGASWTMVGGALGTSGQAAWERYSGNAIHQDTMMPQETLPGLNDGPISQV